MRILFKKCAQIKLQTLVLFCMKTKKKTKQTKHIVHGLHVGSGATYRHVFVCGGKGSGAWRVLVATTWGALITVCTRPVHVSSH